MCQTVHWPLSLLDRAGLPHASQPQVLSLPLPPSRTLPAASCLWAQRWFPTRPPEGASKAQIPSFSRIALPGQGIETLAASIPYAPRTELSHPRLNLRGLQQPLPVSVDRQAP